jgi:membrane fusion protein, multidrug efflux system
MATALKEDTGTQPSAPPPEVEEAPPSGVRRFIVPLLVVIAAGAGLWWGYTHYMYARAHISTDDATVDGHIVPVIAKVSGYVQRVNVDENEHVAGDSLLVQIDPSEYAVRLAQAQADLAAAVATAGGAGVNGQAQAMVETATGQRGSLDAQIIGARANATKAHSDLARMQDLVAKQIVSKQQLDAAQAAADAADAAQLSLERQVTAATGSIANAQAGVRLAQARLQSSQAAVKNAQLQVTYTHVVAPEAGIISKKQVEPGQLVQAGQPMMEIVADTGIWITANFKETQLAQLRVGEAVEIDVDAYDGAAAQGRVESLSAATGAKFSLLPPDNATGNFTKVVQRLPVRIAVTQGLGNDRPLRPGMSVTVHVNPH